LQRSRSRTLYFASFALSLVGFALGIVESVRALHTLSLSGVSVAIFFSGAALGLVA
jgi:hypothetical protein